MRIRTLLIALVLFSQLSCSNDDVNINSFHDDASITTLNGTWKVVSFEDYDANTIEYKTEENSWGKDIIVTFDDTLNPMVLSGKVTTNSVHGEFGYVGVREFNVSRYMSTYVMQPVWADKFAKAVAYGNVSFKINHQRLRIYYDNQTKSVTLRRE